MTENRELRAILVDAVRRLAGDERRVALLWSGGVDSSVLGACLRNAGIDFTAYTFQVGEWESLDAISAKGAAELLRWNHVLVKCPLDDLEGDFLKLAALGCKKKTRFECTWPMMHLFPKIEERLIFFGLGADNWMGLDRKAQVEGSVDSKKVFDAIRLDTRDAGMRDAPIEAVAAGLGKEIRYPYLEPQVFDYFMRFSWRELNRPIQKYKLVCTFPIMFRRIGARKHANYQSVSGVSKVFTSLLRSELNKKGRSRILDLVRDYSP